MRVATGPDLFEWVERCGLEAHAVGISQAEARRVAAERYPAAVASDHKFTDVWVSAALPGLISLTDGWSPDVIIHEEEEYAALLLGDLLGVFCVTHSWASPARPVELRERAAELLAPVWDAAIPGAHARTTGDLYLDACPPPFQTGAIAAVAATVLPVRPVLFDGPPGDPPEWLATLPRPAAYVGHGPSVQQVRSASDDHRRSRSSCREHRCDVGPESRSGAGRRASFGPRRAVLASITCLCAR